MKKTLLVSGLVIAQAFWMTQVMAIPAPIQQDPEPVPISTPTPVQTNEPAQVTENSDDSYAIRACQELESPRERIRCRLERYPSLTPQQIQYDTPESCRDNGQSEMWNNNCVEKYKSFSHCWQIGRGNARMTCVREALGLGQTLVEGSDTKAVDWLIVFRFYEAEERAAIMQQRGMISTDDYVNFSLDITNFKKNYYKAKTKDDKKMVIGEVIARFNKLVNTIE